MTLPTTESKGLDDHHLSEIADRIRTRIRRTVTDIIDTGQDLAQVKTTLDHGQFSEWIEREFSMSMRSAQRYMQAAEWAEGKSATVSLLQPKTLYLLAAKSTPEKVQTEVISDLEAGKDIDPREIRDRVAEAKEKRRVEQREAAMSPEEKLRRKRSRERLTAERDRLEAERAAVEQRRKDATDEAMKILLKLDRKDLDRLIEVLRQSGLSWSLHNALTRRLDIHLSTRQRAAIAAEMADG